MQPHCLAFFGLCAAAQEVCLAAFGLAYTRMCNIKHRHRLTIRALELSVVPIAQR